MKVAWLQLSGSPCHSRYAGMQVLFIPVHAGCAHSEHAMMGPCGFVHWLHSGG